HEVIAGVEGNRLDPVHLQARDPVDERDRLLRQHIDAPFAPLRHRRSCRLPPGIHAVMAIRGGGNLVFVSVVVVNAATTCDQQHTSGGGQGRKSARAVHRFLCSKGAVKTAAARKKLARGRGAFKSPQRASPSTSTSSMNLRK